MKDVNFRKLNGLVPAIIQDHKSKKVLMLGFMDRTALGKTLKTGTTWFWSRTKKRLWNKGEISGNFQIVKSVYLDCDKDSLLILVKQQGGKTCHEDRISCFYNKMKR